MTDESTLISVGARLHQSTGEMNGKIAVRSIRAIDDVREITWNELDQKSDAVAAKLLEMDVLNRPATILLLTRDAVEHAIHAYGAWKVGQTVLCLPPSIGSVEGESIISRLDRTISVGADVAWDKSEKLDSIPAIKPAVDYRIPDPMILIATGGSTGIPKLVDVLGAGQFSPGAFLGGLNTALKREPRARSFVMTPLSHGAGAATAYMALFEECEVTSLEKFDPDVAIWAINEFKLEQLTTVPTMMHRMRRSESFDPKKLSSIKSLVHTGGHIDPRDKEMWIEAIGPEKVIEVWGSTESVGHAVITGTEWLKHKGSVGRPVNCDIRIVDENGNDVETGGIGEIFVKPKIGKVDIENKYYGSSQRMKALDDYVSFGDMGYLDSDGYLYISGRTDDLIITGGANVFPDEVEIIIKRLPGVSDCVVVGKPDDDLGTAIHAVICMEEGAGEMSIDELRSLMTEELSAYKLPRSVEYRPQMERTDAGKIRRSAYR